MLPVLMVAKWLELAQGALLAELSHQEQHVASVLQSGGRVAEALAADELWSQDASAAAAAVMP